MSNSPVVVTVFRWDNLQNGLVPLIQMNAPSLEGNHPVKIAYPKNLPFKANMLGFERTSIANGSNIPAALTELLPGAFANRLLQNTYSDWSKQSDFSKLARLGSREVGVYHITVNEQQLDKSLLVGAEKLNQVMGRLHLALDKDELNTLLDDSNFYSLTATKGGTPKIEYQDEMGDRWVVKTYQAPTKDLSNAYAKVEHACSNMLDDIGIETPDLQLHECPDGKMVLMSKHYNLSNPILDDSGIAHHQTRLNTMSVKTLSQIAEARSDYVGGTVRDYQDVVNIFETLETCNNVETKRKLMERFIFDVTINNTATTVSNLVLMENLDGIYELAPYSGVIPDHVKNPLSITMAEKYNSQSNVTFDDQFVVSLRDVFGLPENLVKESISRVCSVVANRDYYLSASGLSEQDKQIFSNSFMSNQKLSQGINLIPKAQAQAAMSFKLAFNISAEPAGLKP